MCPSHTQIAVIFACIAVMHASYAGHQVGYHTHTVHDDHHHGGLIGHHHGYAGIINGLHHGDHHGHHDYHVIK